MDIIKHLLQHILKNMAVFESFSLVLWLKTQPSPQYILACNYRSVEYGSVMLYDTNPCHGGGGGGEAPLWRQST